MSVWWRVRAVRCSGFGELVVGGSRVRVVGRVLPIWPISKSMMMMVWPWRMTRMPMV